MKSENKSLNWIEDRIDEYLEKIADQIKQNQRPANQVILDEDEVLKTLKISKRTLATYRSDGLIKYSKIRGVLYYKLSDILDLIDKNRVNKPESKAKRFYPSL